MQSAGSILLLKFTFDYPLVRIVVASVLFFGSVYLMRVLKIGVVFFIVAIVIIYVQTFVDQTDQAELLIRAVLWVWVAVNYPIALTLVINSLLLPAEPARQLKEEIERQLTAVDACLTHVIDGGPAPAPITLQDVQKGAMTLQKLLKFATMRDTRYRDTQAWHLASIATVTRLYLGAKDLSANVPQLTAAQRPMLYEPARELPHARRRACRRRALPHRHRARGIVGRFGYGGRHAASAPRLKRFWRARGIVRQAACGGAATRPGRVDQPRLRTLFAEDLARGAHLVCLLQRDRLARHPYDHADLPDCRAAEPRRVDAARVAACSRCARRHLARALRGGVRDSAGSTVWSGCC